MLSIRFHSKANATSYYSSVVVGYICLAKWLLSVLFWSFFKINVAFLKNRRDGASEHLVFCLPFFLWIVFWSKCWGRATFNFYTSELTPNFGNFYMNSSMINLAASSKKLKKSLYLRFQFDFFAKCWGRARTHHFPSLCKFSDNSIANWLQNPAASTFLGNKWRWWICLQKKARWHST